MTASESGKAGALPIALTMGEPAGIGGEITLKAWLDHDRALSPFFVIDDARRLDRLSRRLGFDVPVAAIGSPDEAMTCFPEALPVLDRPLAVESVPGSPDAANAAAVVASVETAVTLVRDGHAAAVVTNPIHKRVLYDAGFSFPGHTEFLAHLAGLQGPPVMMLAGPSLRVVLVTIHVPLAEAVATVDADAIVTAGRITAAALATDFGIARPRLAVAGLNPHAGEEGSIGRQEIDIIAPAVERLRTNGIDASGPYPPDTLFTPRARAGYDAAVCMYHDQGLIPLKALDVDGGVNVTLGLPFVRTSPDHGTAFNIAGSGRADPGSLIASLHLAAELAARRAAAGK